MGEPLTLYRQSFQLPPEHEDDALYALQAAHAREPLPLATTWSGRDPIASATKLEAALRALGFAVRRDGRGYIVGLATAEDVRAGVDDRLFPVIAPFVDLIAQPDEGLLRYRFDGKTCVRRHVRISERAWVKYVDTHEAELEASELRQKPAPPSWKQVAKTIPEAMSQYDGNARFSSGSWLRHAKFGPGFVLAAADGKIRVLFETGERTLAARR